MIAAQVAFALLIAASGSHAGAVQQRLIWPDVSTATEFYANQPASVEFCFQGHVRNDQEKWTLNLEQSSWFGAKFDLKANFTQTTDQCFEAEFKVPAQTKSAHNYRFRLDRSRAWWFRRNYNPSEQFPVLSVKDAERLFNEKLPATRESIDDEAMPFVVDEPLRLNSDQDDLEPKGVIGDEYLYATMDNDMVPEKVIDDENIRGSVGQAMPFADDPLSLYANQTQFVSEIDDADTRGSIDEATPFVYDEPLSLTADQDDLEPKEVINDEYQYAATRGSIDEAMPFVYDEPLNSDFIKLTPEKKQNILQKAAGHIGGYAQGGLKNVRRYAQGGFKNARDACGALFGGVFNGIKCVIPHQKRQEAQAKEESPSVDN